MASSGCNLIGFCFFFCLTLGSEFAFAVILPSPSSSAMWLTGQGKRVAGSSLRQLGTGMFPTFTQEISWKVLLLGLLICVF